MSFKINKTIKHHKRKVASLMMVIMTLELVLPLRSLALTSGPSQPEFQGFSPLATSSLVDPFSGDFSYNIPLLEIEGYPLNLVYRATSNTEEEASWVGYGWNVNVGTLNRFVRGLPDDMDGDIIKSYQNIRDRNVSSLAVNIDASASAGIVNLNNGTNIGASIQGRMGFTYDNDDYTGEAIGVSIGGGIYAGINAGPFNAGGNAGVTLSANSSSGGSITTYSGFSVGAAQGNYFSIGFGQSVTRTFNTISGWEKPNIVGSFNVSNVTFEVQKNFVSSISNQIPQISSPYLYESDGTGYKLNVGASAGIIKDIGCNIDLGLGVFSSHSKTSYNTINEHRGYGYMYTENALKNDIVDFTRDNDGGLNKDMPFMPPSMKTYDVFSSTAHNATNVFRADRNDFGTVRDPFVTFKNADNAAENHELDIRFYTEIDCWLGVSLKYTNSKTNTKSVVASGGCSNDMMPHRKSNGKDQNLFFKACGSNAMIDDNYFKQIKKYQAYSLKKKDTIKGMTAQKRSISAEPIAVYSNKMIADFPQTVLSKSLESYKLNQFPLNKDSVVTIPRTSSNNQSQLSKIGAILNTNKNGQTYVYATPVLNNIKNEVGFRVNGFDSTKYKRRDGLMLFQNSDATQYNGLVRDNLYKNTLTPAYATTFMLNALLQSDYVDVTNDGITDDDLGNFVKFNYTCTDKDYRWRTPYADKDENLALLNEGTKVTKFDDMGSYVIGSKQLWYAHSMESKNYVVEFYLSPRLDAKDSRSKIMQQNHPFALADYSSNKDSFSVLQKLDSIKYYNKHDRLINKAAAIPLKTIYFNYDYGISSNVPNSNAGGKLRLLKVKIRHGNEPIEFADNYDFGYTSTNPEYHLGDKDGWGNYYPNSRPLPLCEFPYADQSNTVDKDLIASAFHLNYIKLPSGGKINIEYEADDYAYVQNKHAMHLQNIVGVGPNANLINSDVEGLFDNKLNAYLYIYVKKPDNLNSDFKNYLLNGANLMYFSFNIKIAGGKFKEFDQVKGYAEVEDIGICPNESNYLFIKVKPTKLTGTSVKPSPMTNTAINMARAYVSDQLYFQDDENSDGKTSNMLGRLDKAINQVKDAILGNNSIQELMKDYSAGRFYNRNKSFVRLALTKPKIGGGSRVSKLTFDDQWSSQINSESSTLIGYNYDYKDENGNSSGVASYEPLMGGEENPLRSGSSYALSDNQSSYPPYDPIEMIKEDPAGESFYPTGAVGYSRVTIESIHKAYARSAQTKVVHEFYTAKDFPFFSTYSPKIVKDVRDLNYPTPDVRDILLGFLGISSTSSSSKNEYEVFQNFIIETNDMHGKPKGTYNYRLLYKNGIEELMSSTEYYYHDDGNNKLTNEVDVLEHQTTHPGFCNDYKKNFPLNNIIPVKRTLGVDIDVSSDSREVVTIETRNMKKRGLGLKFCFPPMLYPNFTWVDNEHKHTDYYKASINTKIINRYGILKAVKNYNEGAETVVENKYFDAITGNPVVQVLKDKYGDNIYETNIPAYWTKTDLEPAYHDYPFYGKGKSTQLPDTLKFIQANSGFVNGGSLIQTSFKTNDDIFHPGDEIFVKSKSSIDPNNKKWYRLYVSYIKANKNHYLDSDPLAYRYGSNISSGATFEVFLMPYKVQNPGSNDLSNGSYLFQIDENFKYKTGRKNLLNVSTGNFQSLKDPFQLDDSILIGQITFSDLYPSTSCYAPNFLNPVINASANRYASINALLNGNIAAMTYNPVSTGVINQPYPIEVYTLFGNRVDLSASNKQRRHGALPNWYYWLADRYDSTADYYTPKSLLKHFDNISFNGFANAANNAVWNNTSKVTKAIPDLGPVEETSPLGIYQSIYLDPLTHQVVHQTSNGKYGQTWVENFENFRQCRQYNDITDLQFSPFSKFMTKSSNLASGYQVANSNQQLAANNNFPSLSGSFILDSLNAHSGVYSIKTNSAVAVKLLPKKYNGNLSYYLNLFDFNLDNVANQKYTCELWVKKTNGNTVSPSIIINGLSYGFTKVANAIDEWVLYRNNIPVSDSASFTLVLPTDQYYDDLRLFPSTANVKSFVYHPFKNYLMAVLDENNFATFYEYDSRNQLIRLKKETEKGIITVNENIKNLKAN